jgi:hypothetical protein
MAIAPDPDLAVNDRLDGGTKLIKAEALIEILLLAIS